MVPDQSLSGRIASSVMTRWRIWRDSVRATARPSNGFGQIISQERRLLNCDHQTGRA